MQNKNIFTIFVLFVVTSVLSSNIESFAQVSNLPANQGGSLSGNLQNGSISNNFQNNSLANNLKNGSLAINPQGSTGAQAGQGNLIGGIIANDTSGSSQTITIAKGVGSGGPNGTCVGANNCFNPHTLNVNQGSTVNWANNDNVIHTITSGKSTDAQFGKLFDRNIASGKTVSILFNKTGTVDYFCKVHPWMSGQVVVGASGNSSGLTNNTLGPKP